MSQVGSNQRGVESGEVRQWQDQVSMVGSSGVESDGLESGGVE